MERYMFSSGLEQADQEEEEEDDEAEGDDEEKEFMCILFQ